MQQPRHGAVRAGGARARCCARSQRSSKARFAAGADRRRQAAARRRTRPNWCCARTTAASASARCARPTPPTIEQRHRAARSGARTPGTASAAPARAAILERAADLLRARPRAADGGDACARPARRWTNALAEVREAVDFLRYYAARRAGCSAGPVALRADRRDQYARAARPRRLRLHPPWNFPLAIFTGQVAAALAAGNAGARQAGRADAADRLPAAELLHEAGVPRRVLQLLPGDGGRSARRWSRTRAWRASPSPARTRQRWAIQNALADRRGADRALDRRDRRAERHDRRLQRAARAGGPRRGALGLRLAPASAARPRALFFVQEDVADR